MKLKVLIVDLETSPRMKRWGLRLGILSALLLGGGGIAYAAGLVTWSQGQTLNASDLNNNFSVLQDEIASLQAQAPVVASGTVAAYAGPVAPSGWLLCDGSAVSRTTYASLFTAIGTTAGSGDGATTFNLPDYRGMFLRGVDVGDPNTRDPDANSRLAAAPGGNTGNAVGSIETDSFASHSHGYTDTGHTHSDTYTGWGGSVQIDPNYTAQNDGPSGGIGLWTLTTTSGLTVITSITIQASGGSETRPKNAYVNYIIKE